MWTSSVACSPMTWTPSRRMSLAAEDQLQEARRVADDLAARDVGVAGAARRRSRRPAPAAPLRSPRPCSPRGSCRCPSGRSGRDLALEPRAEGVAHGHAGLLDAGGGQRGGTDDVARGVDVRDGGLVLRVHRDQAALAGRDSGRAEVEVAVLLLRPAATQIPGQDLPAR